MFEVPRKRFTALPADERSAAEEPPRTLNPDHLDDLLNLPLRQARADASAEDGAGEAEAAAVAETETAGGVEGSDDGSLDGVIIRSGVDGLGGGLDDGASG